MVQTVYDLFQPSSIYNNYIPVPVSGSSFFTSLRAIYPVSAYESDQNPERTQQKLFPHAQPR